MDKKHSYQLTVVCIDLGDAVCKYRLSHVFNTDFSICYSAGIPVPVVGLRHFLWSLLSCFDA